MHLCFLVIIKIYIRKNLSFCYKKDWVKFWAVLKSMSDNDDEIIFIIKVHWLKMSYLNLKFENL